MSVILQLFPEVLDVNGDAQNALVLARRAAWSGIDAEVLPVAQSDAVSRIRPAAVVIGSSVDAELSQLRSTFETWAPALRDWAAAGIPILAVGTGLELIGDDGIGLVPGRAVPLESRATGELVVDGELGRLVGFENHARGFQLDDGVEALGRVVTGVGNDGRLEGVRHESVWGTHLHGPVLAKNPVLADELLTAAYGAAYAATGERTRYVDGVAQTAREATLTKLGIGYSES